MRAPDRSSKVDALERWADVVEADDLVEADTARLRKPTEDPDGETQPRRDDLG